MKRVDFPTARVETRDAAGKLAQLGALAKHRVAVAGRFTAQLARGVFTASCGFGVMAWIGMHASSTRTYRYEPPRFELPKLELPAYDPQRWQAIEQELRVAQQPVWQAPPAIDLRVDSPPAIAIPHPSPVHEPVVVRPAPLTAHAIQHALSAK